jgi:hypothetical protein
MPYGWRRCEQSYNSVAALKGDCKKIFPDRFATNHSLVQSPNVRQCSRSEHRTISSTLSSFGEEVGRLHCDVQPSPRGAKRRIRARYFAFVPRRIPFVPESYSSWYPSYSDFSQAGSGREGFNLPLAGAQKRLTQGASFRDLGVT